MEKKSVHLFGRIAEIFRDTLQMPTLLGNLRQKRGLLLRCEDANESG